MARKYAFLQDNKVLKIEDLEENDVREQASKFQGIVDIEDIAPQPQINWLLDGNKLIPPTPLPIDATYIKQVIMNPAKKFIDELMEQIIAENILMGVTQLGKTPALVGFLTLRVPIPNTTEQLSILGTITGAAPSLTVTIQILDYHIAHITDYADLAPFITLARLKDFRNKISTYLGLPNLP